MLDPRFFTRERLLTLEITLALVLNMVRPGERLGYQKVIDRFFSDTGLAFPGQEIIKPPDKAAFQRARKKIPVEVFQLLFAAATDRAQALADQHSKLTWKGFRVLAIDGTKKNLPTSQDLRDYFDAPTRPISPRCLPGCCLRSWPKSPSTMAAPLPRLRAGLGTGVNQGTGAR